MAKTPQRSRKTSAFTQLNSNLQALRSEAVHYADMMDCHIVSMAHNATITGQRFKVCATFTIEMRQRAGIQILIISFPWGGEASTLVRKEADNCILAIIKKTGTRIRLVKTLVFKSTFPTEPGEIYVCMCNSGSLCSLQARQGKTWHTGSHLIPLKTRWWEDGGGARQRRSILPCPKESASVVLIVRHPLALFR